MSYVTAVLINNDAIDVIERDPDFGKKLGEAIAESFGKGKVGVEARAGNHIFARAAEVIHQRRSDKPFVLMVCNGSAEIVS